MKGIFRNYNVNADLTYGFSSGELTGEMHFHLHYEINCVTSGKISVINNGTFVECSAPCILIHAPCTFHAVISDKNTLYERYPFHFSESFVKRYNPSALAPGGILSENFSVIPLTGKAAQSVISYLSLFHGNTDDPDINSRYFAYLIDLVTRFYNSRLVLDANSVNKNNLGYVGDMLVYISENYHKPITVESLAQSFFVSKAKLNRDFKSLMGNTLKQHILDVRISNAMRLLTKGESVIDTAHKCGFTDESHFIKTFRERVGSSPGKYTR